MAIANSLNWSRASTITCRARGPLHSQFTTKFKSRIPVPFISFLFLNCTSRSVRADSAACSSPVLEDTPAVDSTPVIELALNLDEYDQTNGHLPDDSAELNALIRSLFRDSETHHLAYEYYRKARGKDHFTPERYTLTLVVNYLIRTANWSLLFSLIEDVRVLKVLPDTAACCRLVSVAIKARKLKLVNSFVDVLILLCNDDMDTAVLPINCSMKCCNELHMYRTTIAYYQRMKSAGLDLNLSSYHHIMKGYMKLGQFEKVVVVFEDLDRKKIARNGQEATTLYSRIYWFLCESLGRLGRNYEALEYFREMSRKGIPENHSLYASLIGSFTSRGDLTMAEELLQEAEGKEMVRDPALFLKLVLRYIKDGIVEKTLDVVAVMRRANVRVSDCILCAIVNSVSKKHGYRGAAKVYEQLVADGCEPGQVTYASIVNVYTRLGAYAKAEATFSEMETRGFDRCVVAYSSMVAAYAKMGRPRDATRLIAKMKARGCEPNVWTYNAILDMHGRAQNLRQVEKTWKEMERRRVAPDRVSYTTVIGAYNRAREYGGCVKYYEDYKGRGGKIDRAMAGIMVGVMSKMNRVDGIVEVLQEMKMEGMVRVDGRFYRSAMNALREAGLVLQARWMQQHFKMIV
ncbi:pentatricopeptide repeat-containing protein At5g13770, chloroplastic [Andrographis paniculata]|uniref:pentatricopeptide repeat-containing protein At5g13770, chloroplastic n=1 Tax=Andrographis paniculata TaxID=175694 RepID=UPI0021E9A50C|nr:pentatricopeptide repeat-containing protein At5g13770, chloroplastic [Andrographis paniculata]